MVGKSRTEENPENKSETNSTATYIINEYKRCKLASNLKIFTVQNSNISK